jgi:hypothetical protein
LDGFQIEAQYFGAAGPIDCIIDGFDFICDTQTVVPEAYGLGRLGWGYSIEYEGKIPDLNSNDYLEGMARISFTGVDADTLSALSAVGVNPEACSQSLALQLGYRY